MPEDTRFRCFEKARDFFNIENPRCIYCIAQEPDSREHVVPQALGGRFWLPISCTACNNRIGSRLESALLKADVVQKALSELSGFPYLRRLVARSRRYLKYEGKTSDGDVVPLTHGKAGPKVRRLRLAPRPALPPASPARPACPSLFLSLTPGQAWGESDINRGFEPSFGQNYVEDDRQPRARGT